MILCVFKEFVTYILPFITLFFAIQIPYKLSWEQQYSSLLEEYRSFDYAIALQGVIQFFVKECGNDVDFIKEKYKERFIKEVENKTGNIDKENCLHFQRRLLAQFFCS